MSGTLILIIFAAYFGSLYLISHIISKKSSDNDAFFSGNKKSPWYIIAIGMIGTSISGVTFVSVPGMVGKFDMTYMQMVFGFFFGYLAVAYLSRPSFWFLFLQNRCCIFYTITYNRICSETLSDSSYTPNPCI